MCGIVGMMGNLNKSDWALMRHLLFMDTTRGVHSSGFYYVKEDGEVCIEKAVGSPGNLYENEGSEIWDWEGKVRHKAPVPKLIVGHNRYATAGKVTVDNAHPFQVGDWTGVHNGSLDRFRNLCEGIHEVDSKYMIAGFNERGFVTTWEAMRGAAAVVAYDQKNDLLHVARNEERPLVFAKLRGNNAWIFASEAWMLHALYMKDGVSSLLNRPECSSFKKNTLNTVKINKDGCYTETTPLKENTTEYRSFYRGGGRAFGSSNSSNNVTNLREKIKQCLKKDNNSSWPHNTTGWKEAENKLGVDVGDHLDIRLMPVTTTSLSPWVVHMKQKTLRHISFTVAAGHELEGVPVFVYLDDQKAWAKIHGDQSKIRDPQVNVRFNSRPRVVVVGKKVIAIHCSIRSLWIDPIKQEEKKTEEKFQCYMCEEKFDMKDRIDLPPPDNGGITHDVCVQCATTLGYVGFVKDETNKRQTYH